MRFVVVGGGILGLATGYQLLSAVEDAEVVVLEKEREVAMHQSSHNSGVVHAGLYYTPGSLKARLCRRGIGLMREFCAAHGVRFEACGKLVVATETHELGPLERLAERAGANGVPGLRLLTEPQIREVEPCARGLAALHSPETAVTDFGAVARAVTRLLIAGGCVVRTGAPATRVVPGRRSVEVDLADGTVVQADRAIVCAGVHADRLARASGEPANPRIIPFRGEYWKLRPERAHLVRGLIYPVPAPGLPFLGVHLTRTVDRDVLLGPNAVLALGRESGSRARDAVDTFAWPGTWRMMRRHWRAGAGELRRSLSKRSFIGEIRRYVPAVELPDAVRGPVGVRAQAVDRDGSLVDDFRLGVTRGVVWVRNAPSPAATSSLAIAEELVARALQ